MKVVKNTLLMILALLTASSSFAAGQPNKLGRAFLADFSTGRYGDVSALLEIYRPNDNEIREALAYLSQFYEKPGTKQIVAQELRIDLNNMDPLVATLVAGLQHELEKRKWATDMRRATEEKRLQDYYYR